MLSTYQVSYPYHLTSLAMANALDPSVFDVVNIVLALLIQETMAIDVVHLLNCQVSCDWVSFIKFNQWNALFEPFMVIPKMPG